MYKRSKPEDPRDKMSKVQKVLFGYNKIAFGLKIILFGSKQFYLFYFFFLNNFYFLFTYKYCYVILDEYSYLLLIIVLYNHFKNFLITNYIFYELKLKSECFQNIYFL